MFDIAWSELLVIGVVALVVVGPKDLPKLMRTAGQWAGRARAMADQFRRSFDDMARQSELEELRQEMTKLKNANPISEALADSGITDLQRELDRETDEMLGYISPDSSRTPTAPFVNIEEAPAAEATPASFGKETPFRNKESTAPAPTVPVAEIDSVATPEEQAVMRPQHRDEP